MNVSELIELLKTFPQDLPVAYSKYSEQRLMREDEITLEKCCEARADGWVHEQRADKPTVTYLMFPGN